MFLLAIFFLNFREVNYLAPKQLQRLSAENMNNINLD